MKTIKITSNQLGNYYFGSEQKQHAFKMFIYDGKDIANVDGKACSLQFMVDEDKANESILNSSEIENIMNNMYEIIEYSLKYINCIISATDYKGMFFAFFKYYKQHFDEINTNLVSKNNLLVSQEIERLQKQLSWNSIAPEPSDLYYENYAIDDHIRGIKRMISSYEKDNSELKEDSKSYQDNLTRIEKYKAELSEYEDLIKV